MGSHKTIAFLGLNVGGMMDRTLEKEIAEEENEDIPSNWFHRARYRCGHVLHNKITLLIIVVLCIIDCALVIGGLIIELKIIKDMQQEIEQKKVIVNGSESQWQRDDAYHYTLNKLSHAFHYASIAILAILLFETIIKFICFGRKILKNKFEVFDALVTAASFALDLVYLDGTIGGSTIDTAETLSIMLPWRVVRVVNSLVMSLLLHEHIKLMLMFKSKVYAQKQIREISEDLDIIMQQMGGVKELAIAEGIPDWKINRVVGDIFKEKKKYKTDALKSMVSMAMSAAVSKKKSALSLNALAGHSVDALNHPEKSAMDGNKMSQVSLSTLAGHSINAFDYPERSDVSSNHSSQKRSWSSKSSNIYNVLEESDINHMGNCNDGYDVNEDDVAELNENNRLSDQNRSSGSMYAKKQRQNEAYCSDTNVTNNSNANDEAIISTVTDEQLLTSNETETEAHHTEMINGGMTPNGVGVNGNIQQEKLNSSAITFVNETSQNKSVGLRPSRKNGVSEQGKATEIYSNGHVNGNGPTNENYPPKGPVNERIGDGDADADANARDDRNNFENLQVDIKLLTNLYKANGITVGPVDSEENKHMENLDNVGIDSGTTDL